MQRLHIFLIILFTAVSVLVSLAVVAWYLAVTAPSYYGSSWMGQMWGRTDGMMGGGTGTSSYLWIVPVMLIAAVAVAVVGVIFYLVFPELRFIRGNCNPAKTEPVLANPTKNVGTIPVVSSTATNSCEVLLKTMTPEEQKVLNVLVSHQGKYLQKYVSKEAGLSRLKTHRVVARFAQRGIVTVKEYGNTNEILLSDWIKGSSAPPNT